MNNIPILAPSKIKYDLIRDFTKEIRECFNEFCTCEYSFREFTEITADRCFHVLLKHSDLGQEEEI